MLVNRSAFPPASMTLIFCDLPKHERPPGKRWQVRRQLTTPADLERSA
jgi:hypothetical protein